MASTAGCPVAGMANEEKGYYAVQFHPEVTHTLQGRAMLERFVRQICGCSGDWVMGDYIEEAVARIREQVGNEEVILAFPAASTRRSRRRSSIARSVSSSPV